MAKYRKKPVVIEAEPVAKLLSYFESEWNSLPEWVREAYESGVIAGVAHDGFSVKTLEGKMRAHREDMLIQGVAGEIYPCKPSVFKETYEPVEPMEEGSEQPAK